MKFHEVVTIAKKYSSVVFLDRVFPNSLRFFLVPLSVVVFTASTLFFVAVEMSVRYKLTPLAYTSIFAPLVPYEKILFVTAIFSFIIFWFFYSLHTFSRYYMLASIERVFSSNKDRLLVSYEAGKALKVSESAGFVFGLLKVPESQFILSRLQLSKDDVRSIKGVVLDTDGVVPEYNKTVTIGSLWKMLYEQSEEFQKILLSHKVQKEIFENTCDWLDRIIEDEKRESAWWWRENLSKTRGIAKSLSYGGTFVVSKYAHELAMSSGDIGKVLLHKKAIFQLEEALSKNHGANAVIIGNRGTGRHTVVSLLSRMIDKGDCYAEIEHKRLFEFDNNVLGSLPQGELISVLGRCFDEAIMVRNIIFVFNDLPSLYEMTQRSLAQAAAIGEDCP